MRQLKTHKRCYRVVNHSMRSMARDAVMLARRWLAELLNIARNSQDSLDIAASGYSCIDH